MVSRFHSAPFEARADLTSSLLSPVVFTVSRLLFFSRISLGLILSSPTDEPSREWTRLSSSNFTRSFFPFPLLLNASFLPP